MSLLTEISGVFVKIVFASDMEIQLKRGLADRPAGRFNRVGQDALYLSPSEEAARVAMGGYVKEDDPGRVLLQYEVGGCNLYNLRHAGAANIYVQARQSWRDVYAAGQNPMSWDAADQVRELNHVGLIDPSRRKPDLWHVTLFRWNESDAPNVKRIGLPVPITVEPDYR